MSVVCVCPIDLGTVALGPNLGSTSNLCELTLRCWIVQESDASIPDSLWREPPLLDKEAGLSMVLTR